MKICQASGYTSQIWCIYFNTCWRITCKVQSIALGYTIDMLVLNFSVTRTKFHHILFRSSNNKGLQINTLSLTLCILESEPGYSWCIIHGSPIVDVCAVDALRGAIKKEPELGRQVHAAQNQTFPAQAAESTCTGNDARSHGLEDFHSWWKFQFQ